MDLNRELRIEDSKRKLYRIRKYTYNRFRRANAIAKENTLNHIRQLQETRELDKIDAIVDRIMGILSLTETPLSVAWDRKYKAFYGYEYVLKNGWAPLFDLVKTNV